MIIMYHKNEKNIVGNKAENQNHILVAELANELFDYGALIPKEWILSNFEIKRPVTGSFEAFEKFALAYMSFVESFKAEMLETHAKYLISVKGEGYNVILPSQQADIAMEKLRKVIKSELNRAVNILQNTNEHFLSLDDIKKRNDHLGNIASLKAFSGEFKQLMKQ
jgi:hypothetical protein